MSHVYSKTNKSRQRIREMLSFQSPLNLVRVAVVCVVVESISGFEISFYTSEPKQ